MSIHDFAVKTLQGQPANLADYKGKTVLIVNVASKCGLTPQYAGLEKIHEQYADKGFAVLGFPCNQFLGQEPGTAEEIEQFCSTTYGVTFPLFEKVDVNGDDRHPLYAELTQTPEQTAGHEGDIKLELREVPRRSRRRRRRPLQPQGRARGARADQRHRSQPAGLATH